MLHVLLLRLGVDQYIIYEYDHRSIQHWSAHPVHQVHERHRCVRQSEGHHDELEMPVPRPKSHLMNVFLPYFQLMVPGAKIDLREPRGSLKLIEEIVDPRQWVSVLHRELIQLPNRIQRTPNFSSFFLELCVYTHGTSNNTSNNSHLLAPGGQILLHPNLKIFTFSELKTATRNF
ncbi:hypothetical protein OSB04_027607 [Centaurea solstitialis]|uniref:Uncharacterized protein n=1 Tax=Centaurea solstitialis TaxID=347529 RepID=A0AA38WAE3_9ASTR|nr:hypothetical protein OSB04_027607 [Centaurea solstitialis]